ncbi:hypothetical protein [Shimia sp.]|uniref:hypothetical protein n=1 Tax=Shimia sp. TaxID=1954381 RepID=UPI003B8E58E4
MSIKKLRDHPLYDPAPSSHVLMKRAKILGTTFREEKDFTDQINEASQDEAFEIWMDIDERLQARLIQYWWSIYLFNIVNLSLSKDEARSRSMHLLKFWVRNSAQNVTDLLSKLRRTTDKKIEQVLALPTYKGLQLIRGDAISVSIKLEYDSHANITQVEALLPGTSKFDLTRRTSMHATSIFLGLQDGGFRPYTFSFEDALNEVFFQIVAMKRALLA